MTAVVVGLPDRERERLFTSCRPATRIDDHEGIDNDEQGTVVFVCSGLHRPWSQVWRSVRHCG